MKDIATYIPRWWVVLPVIFAVCLSATAEGVILVRNGEPRSVIVVPTNMHPLQKIAVDDFVATVLSATGARLEIVLEDDAPSPSSRLARIILGPSSLSAKLGFPGDHLQRDEYRLHSRDRDLVVLARDISHVGKPNNIWGNRPSEDSRMTQWALGHILDRYVGVRWLWPGSLGTHIPKIDDLVIPELDIQFQQPLVDREFNVVADNPDNLKWLGYHHFGGHRRNYVTAHSFRRGQANGDWWEEFRESRPSLLAQSPRGKPEPKGKAHFFKICVSNPASADEIIDRWEAAGAPDYWDVSPNDGNGFCTCDNCRALDRKFGKVDYTPDEIWNRPGHVSLTERYVWFWNKLLRRMREKNPSVKIGVFLYGAFRTPPQNQKLEPGVFGLMVRDFDFESWKEWKKAGVSEIGLRPNWLYMGANGPHLPFAEVGRYIEQARDHNMSVIRMDCFHEYWPTQGPLYYLIGRLVSRPDLKTADILQEYCEGFGAAGPAIAEYLSYWQSYHERVIYNIPAGGSMRKDPEGIYGQASIEHFGELMHPLRGHWRTLPYVYHDEVMFEARRLLDAADLAAESEVTRRRIDFLRDGLRVVELTSAYMLAHERKNRSQMETGIKNLTEFGETMKSKHGYWHSQDIFFLKYWGLIGEEYEMSSGQ